MLKNMFNYQTFFYNDTPTTEIYTLSLHDALPIYAGRDGEDTRIDSNGGQARNLRRRQRDQNPQTRKCHSHAQRGRHQRQDRKSTRLNSSHSQISYAVFCLKKKKKETVTAVVTIEL